MQLTGRQIQQIRDAILDAYPTRDELRALVRIELDQNLDSIAGGDNLRILVFNLVTWAEQHGRIDELVNSAYNQNQGNLALQQLIAGWRSLPRTPIEFDWVTIPAGKFILGSDKQKDASAHDSETPQHTVDVAEFRIARIPVTVTQFAAFIQATNYRTTAEERGSALAWTGVEYESVQGANWSHPRGPESSVAHKQNHPVTCVSWHDAQAFCRWAGVLLPTEAQWEKAARGVDERIYPWGNTPPTKEICNFNLHMGDTTPVGSYPPGASPFGVLDMAGNTWEWTSSLYQPYPYSAADGRETPTGDGRRVLRGGSFNSLPASVRCAGRRVEPPDNRYVGFGFRVAAPPFTPGR